jgi:hypothetical protein
MNRDILKKLIANMDSEVLRDLLRDNPELQDLLKSSGVKVLKVDVDQSFESLVESSGIPRLKLVDLMAESALDMMNKPWPFELTLKRGASDEDQQVTSKNVTVLPNPLAEACVLGASIVEATMGRLHSALMDKLAVEHQLEDMVKTLRIVGDDINGEILEEFCQNLEAIIDNSKHDESPSTKSIIMSELGARWPESSKEASAMRDQYLKFHNERRTKEAEK